MARLPLVKLGIIGLGSDWDESLCPAITKLPSRIRVVAVYDDVWRAALQAARQVHAEPVSAVRTLLLRRDIDALLLRAAGWQQQWLVDRIRERQLPVLVGPDVDLTDEQLEWFHRDSRDEGTIIMPELRLRYIPATLRLRELLATVLGRVNRLVITPGAWSIPFADRPPLVHLLDWSDALTERSPVAISRVTHPTAGSSAEEALRIEYEPRRRTDTVQPVEALLRFPPASAAVNHESTSAQPSPPLAELVCERGSAVILSPTELSWTSDARPTQEQLTSDRTSAEVLLDLFARRVLGGLIPTPDPGDLRRARELARAVARVREGSGDVTLGPLDDPSPLPQPAAHAGGRS